jgi:carbamoyltransferase
MKFLGLRLCEHDSNITYTNGEKVVYYNAERDYQIKHYGYRDLSHWTKVIKKLNVNIDELDAIGIVLDTHDGSHKNIKFDATKLYETIDIPLFKLMGVKCPVFRIDHHYSHLLSAWVLGKPTDTGFIFDGFGDDYICHTIFKNNKIDLQYKLNECDSLGLILSKVGNALNFSGDCLDFAGKAMALKGYGKKIEQYLEYDDIRQLKSIWDFDVFKNNIDNFQFVCDYFSLCHEQTENVFLKHFEKYTNKNDTIIYSGGVAQNTIINTKIKKSRPNLHIPPHCNDSGLSLGIVEFLRQYYEQPNFDNSGYPFWESDESPNNLPSDGTIKKVVEYLANGKIVGWYQGNGELGPRALGNRSILMDPSIKNGKQIINERIKHREFFRPFGASVLEEKYKSYFDFDFESPYMLYVMDVIDSDSFPSITHVDGTCRAQTVSKDLKVFYQLISEFENLTGVPMLLNTSLNNGGKPICGTKNDALELFCNTELDILVFGDEIIVK